MIIGNETMGHGSDEAKARIDRTIHERFELAQGQLTGEAAAKTLADLIKNLPGEGTKVISVVGGPASGKGTIVNAIVGMLAQHELTADVLATDDYNRGTREWRHEHERDDPLALKDFDLLNEHINRIQQLSDGETLAVPTYDPLTGLAIAAGDANYTHRVGRVDVLLVEGDFDPVEDPTMKVFIDVPEEERLRVRIARDLASRGVSDEGKIRESFDSRHLRQFIPYTLPAIDTADVVLRVDPVPDNWQYDIYHTRKDSQH